MDSLKEKLDGLEELLQHSFNLASSQVFFPIRHHSPVCSYHLEKLIELYRPDCILIEGPSETDPLIPHLASADTQTPLSVYYAFNDKEQRSACYYPLLAYSPEYRALKLAAERSLPVHFIDLPFGNLAELRRIRVAARQAEDDVEAETTVGEIPDLGSKKDEDGKPSYFSDYYLQRSAYVQSLCRQEHCRDESELWEKLFEIEGFHRDTPSFVRSLTAFCYYSRVDYPPQLSQEEFNTERESYMASKIAQYGRLYQRLLIVVGGFHVSGLIELLESRDMLKAETTSHSDDTALQGVAAAKDSSAKQFEAAVIKDIPSSPYLIPYSYTECDQLSGYASGMPHPAYYQLVHQNIRLGEAHPFAKANLLSIIELAKSLRRRKEAISLSEEASAYQMTLGLSELRGKQESGVYELHDGVRSAFVKGELSPATSLVLEELAKLLQGSEMGRVGNETPQPPIVEDFYRQTESFRMDNRSTLKKTAMLNIVSSERHRRQSVLLHRLNFLNISYAKQVSGPDYLKRKRMDLIRESWEYAYHGGVGAALIQISHLGGTIEEACAYQVSQELQEHAFNAEQASSLLIQAGIMALFEQSERILQQLIQIIEKDYNFLSLSHCAHNLVFLLGIRHILRIASTERIEEALTTVYMRALSLLPSLTAKDDKEDIAIAEMCRTLYQIGHSSASLNGRVLPEPEILLIALEEMRSQRHCPPASLGAATGLLWSVQRLSAAEALQSADSFFASYGDTLRQAGLFLRGLFLSARDVLFYDDTFLNGLNERFSHMDFSIFLELLPDLRLAFTFFTPLEIQRICHKLSELIGPLDLLDETASAHSLYSSGGIDGDLLELAQKIDKKVHRRLVERGLLEVK